MKQTKLSFGKGGSPKKKGRNAWESDSADDDRDSDALDDLDIEVAPRVREGGRRAAGEGGAPYFAGTSMPAVFRRTVISGNDLKRRVKDCILRH